MAAAPYNSSAWGPSPNGSSSYAPSPYATSGYGLSPSAPSPYPLFAASPWPQQQQSKPNLKAERDEKRDKTILHLKEQLWIDFSELAIPHVKSGPSNLRTKLHNKFRECIDTNHFVSEVEKEIKLHDSSLPNDFRLRLDEKDLIKRIPHRLAHRYIFEQRTELKDGVLVEKQKFMGWDSIAKILSAGMGYRYGKGSCKTYFEACMNESGNSRHLPQFPHASTTNSAAPKRPHSPENYAPAKELRQSEVHLTPAQYSIRDEHSKQAGSFANATEDTMGDTTSPAAAPLESNILPGNLPAFSQESLRDIVTFDIARLRGLLEEEFVHKMRQQEVKIAKFKEDYKRKIRLLEAECESLRETALSAISQKDQTIKDLEMSMADMSLNNERLSSRLEAEQNNKKNLQEQLDTTTNVNKMLEERLTAYENELSSRSIRPSELDNTPSPARAKNPPSSFHDPYVAAIISSDEEHRVHPELRDSGFFGNESYDTSGGNTQTLSNFDDDIQGPDDVDFDSFMNTTDTT